MMKSMALNQDQIRFYRLNGYLMVPDVVPKPLCDQVIETIKAYLRQDQGVADTQESSAGAQRLERQSEGHGIVPLHHAQALWDVRQVAAIHTIFTDLYGTHKLWVSNDRASCKPPAADTSLFREPVHWDCDPWSYNQHGIQGLVYLDDTPEDCGPFMCVPSIYRELDLYRQQHLDDPDRRNPRVAEHELVRVPGAQGSLVVFNRLMPHTSALNRSDRHRYVQYVTMVPVDETQRDRVIAEWREKRLPDWAIRQSISGGRTNETGEPATLTAHGRKIAGIDAYE